MKIPKVKNGYYLSPMWQLIHVKDNAFSFDGSIYHKFGKFKGMWMLVLEEYERLGFLR